ncbi:hypothetical protein BDM02DRAFT_3121357 [Thelephora ganbajun]|uniref:Uncharacterized protein n=1 Tax=Thelephora ganbajun TaxID=370292 RepID=A0ACB6Z4U7_THEGA|nr:hypothetical protein BDM02DRAFT_3121357 [Thelephora ganbajun]
MSANEGKYGDSFHDGTLRPTATGATRKRGSVVDTVSFLRATFLAAQADYQGERGDHCGTTRRCFKAAGISGLAEVSRHLPKGP